MKAAEVKVRRTSTEKRMRRRGGDIISAGG
jgi:hypothetical protein